MTIAILITLCTLLLIAYLFDITSKWTKIPSVLLLLLLGWLARQATKFMGMDIPDLNNILPLLGTTGLVLIVLDGALELEFNKSKGPVIRKSFFVAFFPMLVLALLLALLFHFIGGASYKDSLTNAIPFCVISSSVAISSAKNLTAGNREFVVYESSLSDIIGVLFFNFIALNAIIDARSIGMFLLQIGMIAVVSFIATAALAFMLSKIEHQIKFAPIILLVFLIYAISEVYHLPALVFILAFGLFLGNLDELKRFKWIQKLRPEELNKEVHKLKEIITEATFLIRSLFFLLFGYLMKTAEILNTDTLLWAAGIVASIFFLRALMLKQSGLPVNPLLFMAPRGLINVLLFLAIGAEHTIRLVNTSLVIQVIVLTSLMMMFGLISTRREDLIKLN
jgi:hypothetical protein